jgi:hypothetical protein
MSRFLLAFACLGVIVPANTFAETGTSIAPTPTATILPAPSEAVLRVGTPIALKLDEELTTKENRLKVGQRFKLEVAEALFVSGHVVVPVGTPAVGEVTEIRGKGMWGKSGHISAQALYLRVGDRQVRLSGAFDEKGSTGSAGVVGAVVFLPIAGFLVTGTSAKMPIGMPVKVVIDEDLPVAFTSAPAAVVPLSIPVSPAAETLK